MTVSWTLDQSAHLKLKKTPKTSSIRWKQCDLKRGYRTCYTKYDPCKSKHIFPWTKNVKVLNMSTPKNFLRFVARLPLKEFQ